NLAEEVIASNITSLERRASGDQQELVEQDTRSSPLKLSVPFLVTNAMELTETPPPTATTPPPNASFQLGHLRHRSSTASFSSSANSDRQYTQEGDDRSSRPSSVASSYRRQQRQKSLRQLEPLNNGNNRDSRYDHESNAAFDRICSLLGGLITDASTAVTTAPDGSQLSNIPVPQFEPLVESDSESASSSVADSGTDGEDNNSIGEDMEDMKTTTTTTINNTTTTTTSKPVEVDDPFLRRLQVPEGVSRMDNIEVEVELEPADRCRTGFRSRLDKPNKRLSSLFMELQNTQTIQDATPKEELGRRRQLSEVNPLDREFLIKEKTMRRPRHSISSMSLSSGRFARPHSICLPVTTVKMGGKSAENGDALQDSSESASESLFGRTRKPRQRGSISSLRSEPVHKHTYNNEPQQQKVVVDAELNRTVETIDGLTRDLVAVATHQNWMQMKLQKTLQFQKEQILQIERVHSNADITSLAGEEEDVVANQHQLDSSAIAAVDGQPQLDNLSNQQRPLADLSKSLKQVAVNVGKVLASAKHGNSRKSTSSSSAPSNRTSRSYSGRFAGKDFSRYFQELEKIAALGGKIGFGKGSDIEEIVSEDLLEETSSSLGKKSRSGRKSANNSCRNSAATLVDEDGFSSSLEEPKLAAALHSGDYSDFESAREEIQADHSRRGSSSMSDAPPELEDFAAQCRLLTKALVLPFVQLTHRAMTSQDSALALTPRSGKFSDSARDLDSTLEIMKNFEMDSTDSPPSVSTSTSNTRRSSVSTGPTYNSPRIRRGSSSSSSSIHQLSSPLPNWTSSVSAAGRDLDSILKGHGELSPDTIVKAKAFMSTGLYLLHLVYWTTLFVVGTIVLDPWLAEAAGQQVVRIVDQVKEVTPKDGRARLEGSSPLSLEHPNQSNNNQGNNNQGNNNQGRSVNKQKLKLTGPVVEVDEEEDAAAVKALEQGKLQALEDRAIEVAVGFESLKQRLGSNSGRSLAKGLWNSQGSFESTASALTAATVTAQTTVPSVAKTLVPQTSLPAATTAVMAQRPSQQHAWAGAGLGPVPMTDLMVRRKSL
ncbi:hypothetical protein BGZ58_009798, partial [Dissophora ornata]